MLVPTRFVSWLTLRKKKKKTTSSYKAFEKNEERTQLEKNDSFETNTKGTLDSDRTTSVLSPDGPSIGRLDSMFGIPPPKRQITKNLHQLLENNKIWAKAKLEQDEKFFARLSSIQQPDYLWIGCSDSRVPANQIINMPPGEVFVHRNIANLVKAEDANCQSVIQYAVQNLKVKHIIVCGHLKCGGCRAAFGPELAQPLEGWLTPLRNLCNEHKEHLDSLPEEEDRWNWICRENVKRQVEQVRKLEVVQKAWANKQPLAIHGWVYSIDDGILHDLVISHEDDGYYPPSENVSREESRDFQIADKPSMAEIATMGQ